MCKILSHELRGASFAQTDVAGQITALFVEH